mmetsp:Transcript_21522/g.38339  ORF Transcript_21522/g.38339 Transcript_21522/m.38339 type:complete len:199 (-) Transcript_21522:63-659(-)
MASAVLPQILRENLDYLEQLQESYRSSQDQARLLGIRDVCSELSATCKNREDDIRGAIEGLVAKVSACEQQVREFENAGSAEGRLSCLKESTQLSLQSISNMSSQERELMVKLQHLQQKVRQLRSGTQSEQANQTAAVERLKHELSLYAHISKTTLSAAPEGMGFIAAVSKPTARDVVELTISDGGVESVDRLWDAIE